MPVSENDQVAASANQSSSNTQTETVREQDPWAGHENDLTFIFLNTFRQRMREATQEIFGQPAADDDSWHVTVIRPGSENSPGAQQPPQAQHEETPDDNDDDNTEASEDENSHPLPFFRRLEVEPRREQSTATADNDPGLMVFFPTFSSNSDENVPPPVNNQGPSTNDAIITRHRIEQVQRITAHQESERQSVMRRMTDQELTEEITRIRRLINAAQSDRMTTAFLRARLMTLEDHLRQRSNQPSTSTTNQPIEAGSR